MTTTAWAFAASALVLGVTDWWAVAVDRHTIRWVTKPASLVALIGVAAVLDPADPTVRWWMLAGLVLSLAGDVFLLLEERFFLAGLVSFLLAHLAYIVGLNLAPTSLGWLAVGLGVVVVAMALVGTRLLPAVAGGEHKKMLGPVIGYSLVISAMLVSAFGTADGWAVAGAGLFYVSDTTLAFNRFVRPSKLLSVTVMVTYHLGQAGLVAWLV